jgi:hypothetical protein
MMRRIVLLSLVVLLLGACGRSFPWVVVSQAAPNPLLGQKNFVVIKPDFSKLTVGAKSEAEYLSEKSDEDKAGWAEAKGKLEGEYIAGLRGAAANEGIQVAEQGEAPYVIKPRVDFIEPGYYAFVSARASHVRMTVQIQAPDGKLVDEFIVEHGTAASMAKPRVFDRVGVDGEALGAYSGQYLGVRTRPQEK